MTISIISVSIVSHGQIKLVADILGDMLKYCEGSSFDVILTLNVPEDLPDLISKLPFPLVVLYNNRPLGFGENHNNAFRHAKGIFFCIINPDVRINSNVFPVLISRFKDHSLGVVAPLVVDANGLIEDSARRFPTPFKIICKAIGFGRKPDYLIGGESVYPDWVGGMFMIFPRDVYNEINGFNQKFFLYYEDVDLCARVWLRGLRVELSPQVKATHVARRSSHGNVRYLLIHIRSMMQFFLSFTFLKALIFRMFR
jgi:GT2 family glycosyltransferase